MKKINKILLLILPGIIAAFILTETGLRLIRGKPGVQKPDETFSWSYIDINNKFFKKTDNKLVSSRPGSRNSEISLKKPENEKRVFIVGESIAFLFNTKILKKQLMTILPGYDWQIINCGMSGYDSHRISLIIDEIKNYEPDLIIMMMGHNEWSYEPVKINHWVYKYKILSKFWLGIIVSNYLNPPQYAPMYARDISFKKNLGKIIDTTLKKNIPLAVCTFPRNCKMSRSGEELFVNKKFLSGWWLLSHAPERSIDIFKEMDEQARYYFMGLAYEKMGDQAKALENYRKNVLKNEAKLMNIQREETRAYSNVILVDFDKTINSLSANCPDFNYLSDEMHPWPNLYGLLTFDMLSLIYEKNIRNHLNILSNPDEWELDKLPGINLSKLLKKTDAILIRYIKYVLLSEGPVVSPKYTQIYDMTRFAYAYSPEILIKILDKKHIKLSKKEKASLVNVLTVSGEIFRENKDLKTALKLLNNAIEYDPAFSYAYLFRAFCYYDLNRRKEAEYDFEKLRSLEKDFRWINIEFLDELKKNR